MNYPYFLFDLLSDMGRPRVELGASRLKAECSTTELASHQGVRISRLDQYNIAI
jgi:hypothetical protein